MLDRKRLLDWLDAEIAAGLELEEYYENNKSLQALFRVNVTRLAHEHLKRKILSGRFDNTGENVAPKQYKAK